MLLRSGSASPVGATRGATSAHHHHCELVKQPSALPMGVAAAVLAGVAVAAALVGLLLGVCLTLFVTKRQSSAVAPIKRDASVIEALPMASKMAATVGSSRKGSIRKASRRPSGSSRGGMIAKVMTKARGLFGTDATDGGHAFWGDRVGDSMRETAAAQDSIVETICLVARELTHAEYALFFAVEPDGKMLALYRTKEAMTRRKPTLVPGSSSLDDIATATNRTSRSSHGEEELSRTRLPHDRVGIPAEVAVSYTHLTLPTILLV